MFKKTAIVAGLGLALSTTANALEEIVVTMDRYQFEANGGISGGDIDGVSLGGTYYLGAVNPSHGPLAEAAFLDRASSISVDYSDSEINEFDTEDYAIGARYVMTDSGFIIEGGYLRSEPENQEVDVFNIAAGKYIAENTTLLLGYNYIDVDEGGDADSFSLQVDHLHKLGGSHIKFTGAYAYTDPDGGDDFDAFNLGATWYPCKRLGVGGSYTYTEADAGDVDEFGVSLQYFISQKVAVALSYNETEVDDTDFEIDSTALELIARW